MDKLTIDEVKALIKISKTFEEADNVINRFYKFKTYDEKIAFLLGLFDINNLFCLWRNSYSSKLVYELMLNELIEKDNYSSIKN